MIAALFTYLAFTFTGGSGRLAKLVHRVSVGSDISSIAYSADGKALAAATRDGVSVLNTWNWKVAKQIASPGCSLVAASDSIGTFIFEKDFKVWSLLNRPLIHLNNYGTPPFFLGGFDIGSKGRQLAVSTTSEVTLYDLPSQSVVKTYKLPKNRYGGNLVAVRGGFVGGYGYANFYPSDGSKPFTLPSVDSFLLEFAFARNSNQVFAASSFGKIYSWQLPPKQLKYRRKVAPCSITSLACSDDGRWLVVGTRVATNEKEPGSIDSLSLLDARTGRLVQKVRYKTEGVMALAFNPNSHEFAVADRDGFIYVFDITS